MFGRQVGGDGASHGERRAARRLIRLPALEHDPVGGEGALGSAGHHQADPLGRLPPDMPLEEQLEALGGETPAEVVDAAVSFRLSQDRDDPGGIQFARSDQPFEPGDIVGAGGRDAVDRDAGANA